MKKFLLACLVVVSALTMTACDNASNGGDASELKFNLCYGNKSRTMTYNQQTPLTMPDGSTLTAGNLKPVWQAVSDSVGVEFKDVAVQDQKATEMIETQSIDNFQQANIFGGNSVGEDLMNYGAEGKFVNLSKAMKDGKMPNFKKYIDANPSIASTITAYDGNIYHVPYIAEVGEVARSYHFRESWVTTLLDDDSSFDTETTITQSYTPVVTRAAGNKVEPMKGVTITKATGDNIITIQNALTVKNGETLTEALITYIEDNYSYTNPSELYVGNKAAYDMDELVALFRCIKANPKLLSDNKVKEVYPFFTRHSKYREDIVRFATYINGARAYGSDSYSSFWELDKDNNLQHTYSQEDTYNALLALQKMTNEGLIYMDSYDETNLNNFRNVLYGTDKSENPAFGFMTYDWIASTTASSLNDDVVTCLPPVAEINGSWQYFLDNSRVVKPDGWAISVAGSNSAQIDKALEVFDFYFSEDGYRMQNYGIDDMLVNADKKTYTGPDGKSYYEINEWTKTTANTVAKGDYSAFLRDWIGAIMPVGFQKEIGFEYQYTSTNGFDGWKLLSESTLGIPTYAGEGPKSDGADYNPNYYRLVPSIFSMTSKQLDYLDSDTTIDDIINEIVFNVITSKATAKNFNEYYAEWKAVGIEEYVKTYQAAYNIIKK